jgi:hypothetical protein
VRERHHPPASERTIRDYLTGHPEWLIDDCIGWTREREVADQLAWTARAAHNKYLRVRHAVTLLLSGLAATAITALLALVQA